MEWPLLTVALTPARGHRRGTPSRPAGGRPGRPGRVQPDAPGRLGFRDCAQRHSTMPAAAASPLLISRTAPHVLWSRVTDRGPGIRDLDAVLEGRTAGKGIASARRLVDDFAIHQRTCAAPAVTRSGACRRAASWRAAAGRLPASSRAAGDAASAARPVAELQTQNTELIASLTELRTRQDELVRLNTRTGGHQSRRRRAVCRTGRACGTTAPGQRAEVSLPVQHEP